MKNENQRESTDKVAQDTAGHSSSSSANRNDDATSSETLNELEKKETVSPDANNDDAQDQSNSSTVASPDGEFDADDAGSSRGRTDADPM
ncbi:MAG: hypothetical protein ABR577_17410 [Pyrinomonadaceae bacterium]